MTISPNDALYSEKWADFRSRYPSKQAEAVHPMSRRRRRGGHLRRNATFSIHRFVWAAIHAAIANTWRDRTQVSMTGSSLVEYVLADWLETNGYLKQEWLLEGGSACVPEDIWETWEHHEALRAGKETGKWPRHSKAPPMAPVALSPLPPTTTAQTAKTAPPAPPKSVPATAQWDPEDGHWYWQVNRHWQSYADGMIISGAEPSWVRAEHTRTQQAEAERQQQERLLEQALAEERARDRGAWMRQYDRG